MSNTTVLGSAPIAFTTAEGKAISIPLSALSFDANNEIQLDIPASYKSEVESWLKYLVQVGNLKPGKKPTPKPAMIIEAKNPGEAGNNIQIEFKNINITPDPANTTFTATIIATETYNLSFKKASDIFIEKVLESSTLVHVKGAGTATESAPKDKQSYALGGGNPTAKSFKSVDAEGSATPAFIIEAKNNGADGDDITIKISGVDATASTYTLTAVWQPTFTNIKLTDLPGKLQGSQDIIVLKVPEGASFAIPDAGVVVLNGGADKKDAVKATATAFIS